MAEANTITAAESPRATSAVAMSAAKGQGLFLTGQLLSAEAGKTYFSPAKNEDVTPGVVKLLVGDASFVVEYRSLAEAMDAVGPASRFDTVTIAVYAQGSWDPAAKRRGRASFQGARS